jgi:hypothetical protein
MSAGVVLVQLGLALSSVGALSVLRPLAFLGLSCRAGGAALLGFGLHVVLAGVLWPAPDSRGQARRRIDDFLPVYHFNEVHQTRIRATPERVASAIRAVTPGDIRLARTLMTIRSLGLRRWDHEAAARPMLDVAASGSFLWLAREEREMVVGTVGQFWRLRRGERASVTTPEQFVAFGRAGWARAAMDFVVEDEGGGYTRLTTETRVAASDPATRRTFAAYWRVIYPGSALLRRTWLAAVKHRAERL